METIEARLKSLILSKYKSILDFTKAIGMPYSTMDSMFKRGLGNANVTNVIKVCKALGISADGLGHGEIVFNEDATEPPTNSVIAITRGGDKVQYDLTEAELQAVLTILDGMKKK